MIMFDRKKVAGAAVARTSEDGKMDYATGEDATLKLLARDIKTAITSGDEAALVKALKAFFYECDSDEGPQE